MRRGSPAALPYRSTAPPRAARGGLGFAWAHGARGDPGLAGVPLHLRAAPTLHRERCVDFRTLHRIPLPARGRQTSPAPGDPLIAPLVALPRRWGGYPTPERASPLPGGVRVPAPCAGHPGRNPALGPGLAGRTSAGASPRTPCWPWSRCPPGCPPRLSPHPQRRQRLAAGSARPRGGAKGPPGPGWRLTTARPSTESHGPAHQLRHPPRPLSLLAPPGLGRHGLTKSGF